LYFGASVVPQGYSYTNCDWLDDMIAELKRADRKCIEALRKTLNNPAYVTEYEEANKEYERIRGEILARIR